MLATASSGSTSTAPSTSSSPRTFLTRPLDGYRVEAGPRAVALALELDDELLREGLAREIVHGVQYARRDSGSR